MRLELESPRTRPMTMYFESSQEDFEGGSDLEAANISLSLLTSLLQVICLVVLLPERSLRCLSPLKSVLKYFKAKFFTD